MAIFVSSFDAASPFANWTVSTGWVTATGRTLNCASANGGGKLQKVVGSMTTMSGGAAVNVSDFSNYPIQLDDSANATMTAQVQHIGDGRLKLVLYSYLNPPPAISGPSDFVINLQQWYFFELIASVGTFNVVASGPSNSTVTIGASATLYVDNTPILTVNYNGTETIPNASVLTPVFNRLGQAPYSYGNNFKWDDVYIDTAILGDGSVVSTDTTWDVNVVDPYETQQLLELLNTVPSDIYMTHQLMESINSLPTDVYMTHMVLEIIKSNAPSTLAISCPIISSGALGIPYSSSMIVTGGVSPFTFSIIGGSLPLGLTLNASTGVISGTPSSFGTFSYTVKVTDVNNNTAQSTCSLKIIGGIYSNVNYPYPC